MNNDLLKELYRKYYKEIYLYLFSLSNSAQLAEDLTQDTFLKALLSLQDSHTNMRAWLYLVARNLYYNYRKKYEGRFQSVEIPDDLADAARTDDLNRIIESEQAGMLHKAISALEERYREVLVLQYFGKLSQKEIAALLKVSPENVRVMAYRGKKLLKEELERMHYEL